MRCRSRDVALSLCALLTPLAAGAEPWAPSTEGLLLAGQQNGVIEAGQERGVVQVASDAVGTLARPGQVLAVVVVGSVPRERAVSLERELARTLVAAGLVAAALTSEDTGGAPSGTNEAVLEALRASGVDGAVILRPLLSAGERTLIVQVLDKDGGRVSALAEAPFSLRPPADPAEEEDGGAAPAPTSRSPTQAPDAKARALAAFEARALRISARNALVPVASGYGKYRSGVEDGGFAVWGPGTERMTRAEALRYLGTEALAERQESAVWLIENQWWIQLSGAALFVSAGTALGLLAGGSLRPDPGFSVVDNVITSGTLGFGAGSVVYLITVFPTALLVGPLMFVSDEEMLQLVVAHNLRLARELGLEREDLPFHYLGY